MPRDGSVGPGHSEERVDAMVAMRAIKPVKPWMTVRHPPSPGGCRMTS